MSERENISGASPPVSNNNIIDVIHSIMANKERILDDPDLDETAYDLTIYKSLITEFDLLDRRKNETEEQRKKYEDQRNDEKNILVSTLLDMMRSKIELFENELTIAEKIQKKLIPEKLPDIPGYELHAYYHPSKHVGGDYYDFHVTTEEKFYFLIADVSGHGIPSSLVVSSMQAYIYAQIEEQKSISSMIENLNRYLIHTLLAGKFVTMFLGVLDLKSGAIKYINAGHNPPFIIRKNGSVSGLKDGGPILGSFEDISFTTGSASLDNGDILALYTDGVVEPMNKQDEEFSEERFLSLVKERCDKPLIAIIIDLFRELREFCEGNPYQDDVTLLFIRKQCPDGKTS